MPSAVLMLIFVSLMVFLHCETMLGLITRVNALAFGQLQHPLSDDVVLDLARTGRDRHSARGEKTTQPASAFNRAGRIGPELMERPQQLVGKHLDPQIEFGGMQLAVGGLRVPVCAF